MKLILSTNLFYLVLNAILFQGRVPYREALEQRINPFRWFQGRVPYREALGQRINPFRWFQGRVPNREALGQRINPFRCFNGGSLIGRPSTSEGSLMEGSDRSYQNSSTADICQYKSIEELSRPTDMISYRLSNRDINLVIRL